MVHDALLLVDGPAAIRYPKGAAQQVAQDDVGSGLRARGVRRGSDVCILAVGKLVEAAEEAALLLERDGVSATVWDVRLVKPLDPAMLADAAAHPFVVTVEDGFRTGGVGMMMADAIAELDQHRESPPVLILGVPDRFIPQAKPAAILTRLGLDGPGIAASTLKALRSSSAAPVDV